MADALVFNIPLSRLDEYPDDSLVVRDYEAGALQQQIDEPRIDRLAYVQLLGLPSDPDNLIHWAPDLSIEIVLDNPADDFPQLYRFAKLLDNHPVRVAIPVVAGFDNAVKLALSLQFSVRLVFGQPGNDLVQDLVRLLDAYLHQPTISQPIEIFHNLLLAFCHDESLNLWAAQEDDPALLRYIDDHGRQHLPGRLIQTETEGEPFSFVEDWAKKMLDDETECAECDYFDHCQGYFKWPDPRYDCAGVKTLFATLREAAGDLRGDLASAEAQKR